jgi:hypothetical protein
MIAHGRSDSDLLERNCTGRSSLQIIDQQLVYTFIITFNLKNTCKMNNVKVILTTDHGSIRSLRGAKVLGDREASTNLRFKYGRNLKVDDKHAIYIKNPLDYQLPKKGMTINYIIAKEDYYFVYPTDYHKFLSYYKDTFQHGGISMEEMILPVVTLEPK